MILFLNFAPLEFHGGAERWVNELAQDLARKEPVTVASVHPSIANIYGKIVLKRSFDARKHFGPDTDSLKRISLSLLYFIPFTAQWRRMRQAIREARVIYMKFEVLELAIALWFGGPGVFKKTIAGLHSPFLYADPRNIFDRLHKLVYESRFIRNVLGRMAKIHVLNRRDETFLMKDFGLKRVYLIPNGIDIRGRRFTPVGTDSDLRVLFVGELTVRKGIDTLLKIIDRAPEGITFTIAGDGPHKAKIQKLAGKGKCSYRGYLEREELENVYNASDMFLFPSRAEGMGLVILEAMYYGVRALNSRHVSLALPPFAEVVATGDEPEDYLKILKAAHENITTLRSERQRLHDYCVETFSQDKIRKKLISTLFV